MPKIDLASAPVRTGSIYPEPYAAMMRGRSSLRRDPSAAERTLWKHLKGLNLRLGTNFRRQAPIGTHIADFADYGRRIVVECEGDPRAPDAAQDRWLGEQGFRVLRVWNRDVLANPDGAIQSLLDLLDAPHPLHPHTAEASAERQRDASPPLLGGDGGGGREEGSMDKERV